MSAASLKSQPADRSAGVAACSQCSCFGSVVVIVFVLVLFCFVLLSVVVVVNMAAAVVVVAVISLVVVVIINYFLRFFRLTWRVFSRLVSVSV